MTVYALADDVQSIHSFIFYARVADGHA